MTKQEQTPVEWLEEIYLTIGIDRDVHFKQAKQMEKSLSSIQPDREGAMDAETILKTLWAIRDKDEFYFMAYGKELIQNYTPIPYTPKLGNNNLSLGQKLLDQLTPEERERAEKNMQSLQKKNLKTK